MLGVSGARRKDLKVNFFDLIFAPHSVTPAIVTDTSTMYQAPTDASTVDALEPAARMQYLGSALYAPIFQMLGEPLAGKVTGMLIEMPTQNILDCLREHVTLKATVDEALKALPEEMRAMAAPPPPSPQASSPVSVLAGASNDLWADDDGEDDELPSVDQLFAAAEKKKRASSMVVPIPFSSIQGGDAMDTDDGAAANGWMCEWDAAALAAEPTDKLSEWIASRLDELLRIPRAVVETLGAPAALELLAAVERIQAAGGMLVEETGKPRTSGGIFIKLLKEAKHLPAAEHAATLERLKREGNEAKKAQQAKKNAARFVRVNSPTKLPTASPVAERVASGPPKPALADYVEIALRRQQTV
ncbi:hypothetical protein Ctob_008473 [Chrysochromulina tobinii]|uniref:Phosphorylated adapter RNA export protein n=1 Tax=Chrysochromulina tobinii TaxID=1460289 RepID=A0A0M0JMP7_9EUKA|nr:hypothetical protein Ctob_008473 [Chrysochromulina tobinii]|eukprot:KOO27770.1 hypothetical protein Ctob_008473 [Chrysochromulina sp. CCMP291]